MNIVFPFDWILMAAYGKKLCQIVDFNGYYSGPMLDYSKSQVKLREQKKFLTLIWLFEDMSRPPQFLDYLLGQNKTGSYLKGRRSVKLKLYFTGIFRMISVGLVRASSFMVCSIAKTVYISSSNCLRLTS